MSLHQIGALLRLCVLAGIQLTNGYFKDYLYADLEYSAQP